jgi:hypothetical protein
MAWVKGVSRKATGNRLPAELLTRPTQLRAEDVKPSLPRGVPTLPLLPSLREPLYVIQLVEGDAR